MKLLDPAAVGERLGLSPQSVIRLTREQGWPHVRFSQKVIRYRPEYVEQIVARYDRPAAPTELPGLAGQTSRSRAYNRRRG